MNRLLEMFPQLTRKELLEVSQNRAEALQHFSTEHIWSTPGISSANLRMCIAVLLAVKHILMDLLMVVLTNFRLKALS